MFEAAEVGRTVAKAEYEFEVAKLRWDLLEASARAGAHGIPLIVVFGGVDGAGKSETVHLLNEWMDPRWIVNRAFDEPSEDERERPPFWRYWLALPPRGRIGLFLSAWYSQPLLDRVARRLERSRFDAALDRIASFERTLADDGAIILKFWMHLTARRRRSGSSRCRRIRSHGGASPGRSGSDGSVRPVHTAAERLIRATSFAHAPWTIVDGTRRAVSKPCRGNPDPARAVMRARPASRTATTDGRAGARECAAPASPPPTLSRASIATARSSIPST